MWLRVGLRCPEVNRGRSWNSSETFPVYYASILCRHSFHTSTAFLQAVVYVAGQCSTMPRLCVHTPCCVVAWLIGYIVLLQCCGKGKVVRLPRCTGSVGCMSELPCHYSAWLHFHNRYLACGDIMRARTIVCVCTYVRTYMTCMCLTSVVLLLPTNKGHMSMQTILCTLYAVLLVCMSTISVKSTCL